MASPQKEKGYTPIANELIDALSKYRIRGESWQVLCVILRNTYGWNRKEAKLSLGYIAKATGITRPSVAQNLKFLKEINIIGVRQNPNSNINILHINKDFSKWKVLGKRLPGRENPNTAVRENPNRSVRENPTQQNNKAKINKSPPLKTAGVKVYVDEANLMLNVFHDSINPQINYARKDSRDAALWLINKYGFDNAYKAAKYACSVFEETYAPQIKTPAELKDKWANLVKYKNKQDATPER